MAVKRVVVDTNIIISALTAGGLPQKIIQGWVLGDFLALMSEDLRREINSILTRTKILSVDKKRRILIGTLFNQALMVLPRRINGIIFSDENDHFLYELAVTGNADVIVTGDKALLNVKKVSGIQILNPDQFCKNYLKN